MFGAGMIGAAFYCRDTIVQSGTTGYLRSLFNVCLEMLLSTDVTYPLNGSVKES